MAKKVVAALYIAFAPLLWLVVRNGIRWRREAREREERKRLRRKGRTDGAADLEAQPERDDRQGTRLVESNAAVEKTG